MSEDWFTEEQMRLIPVRFLEGAEVATLAHDYDADRESIEVVLRERLALRPSAANDGKGD